jgi:hypothetical protein
MKGNKHYELGQCIKSISKFIWMINQTKYLMQSKFFKNIYYIMYTINIYLHDSLNLNDYIYLFIFQMTKEKNQN